jgi:thioredoxin-dependent peroxiredoxin
MLQSGRTRTGIHASGRYGKDRSLTQLLSAGAIVLYFYPADFTPGCTVRPARCAICIRKSNAPACTWSASARRAPRSHAKIPREVPAALHVLLSDEQKTVIKMYGVNGPLGIGVRRATYLVDAGRRIRAMWYWRTFWIGRHGIRAQGDHAARQGIV